jgi:hypothetical protein
MAVQEALERVEMLGKREDEEETEIEETTVTLPDQLEILILMFGICESETTLLIINSPYS